VSGVAAVAYVTDGETTREALRLVGAQQKKNLAWSGFCQSIAEARGAIEGEENSNKVQVFGQASGASLTTGGCYRPVDLLGMAAGSGMPFAYDGQSHMVSDVLIGTEDAAYGHAAGLFDTLRTGVEVQGLRLVSFRIHATGPAGALAAVVEGSSTDETGLVRITNVVAYNHVEGAGASGDADYRIRGGEATGGLVGRASFARLRSCGAALYVEAEPEGDATAAAGGLAGSANGVHLVGCYAGGHTMDGQYLDQIGGTSAGRANVRTAAGAAGGLVGVLSSGVVESSYATTSAAGTTDVGGLVGTCAGEVRGGCYATGRVLGSASAACGAFVGRLDGGRILATRGENSYLDIVNNPTAAEEGMGAIGAPEDAAASAVLPADVASGDDSSPSAIERYRSFTSGQAFAIPADDMLKLAYLGRYPFRTVAELEPAAPTGADAEGFGGYLSDHYGDWPDIEYLVPNTPTNP
jgi:hypothetical protein